MLMASANDLIIVYLALELLFAPINMRALYTGMPVDDDYCRTIADMVYRAISS